MLVVLMLGCRIQLKYSEHDIKIQLSFLKIFLTTGLVFLNFSILTQKNDIQY